MRIMLEHLFLLTHFLHNLLQEASTTISRQYGFGKWSKSWESSWASGTIGWYLHQSSSSGSVWVSPKENHGLVIPQISSWEGVLAVVVSNVRQRGGFLVCLYWFYGRMMSDLSQYCWTCCTGGLYPAFSILLPLRRWWIRVGGRVWARANLVSNCSSS